MKTGDRSPQGDRHPLFTKKEWQKEAMRGRGRRQNRIISALTKEYYKVILHRQQALMETVSPRITIHSTLITTFGLKQNEYNGVFTNCITLEDLFEK